MSENVAEQPTEPNPFDELSERERRFVEAYAGDAAGNGTEAAEMAGYAGDRVTLAVQSSRLLRKAKVRDALACLRESDELQANGVEVRRFLTRVVRGEETEPKLVKSGDDTAVEQCAPSIKDRLAAADQLSKLGGEYVTKVAQTNGQGEDLATMPLEQVFALAGMAKP